MSADLLAGHLRAPQSLNRYAYARDPVNNIDPLGLFDEPFETCFYAVNENYTPPPWCEGHATDTHEPPDYSNLGGGGNTPDSKPAVNIQALIDCIFAQFGAMSAIPELAKQGSTMPISGITLLRKPDS